MVVFSVLMIAAALSMIRRNREVQNTTVSGSRLIIIGLLVGLVTGFLGAGGGFLIVPALLFYANLDLKYAIATSVFIITINSLIGFAGDLINGVQFDKVLLAKVSARLYLACSLVLAFPKNGWQKTKTSIWMVYTDYGCFYCSEGIGFRVKN